MNQALNITKDTRLITTGTQVKLITFRTRTATRQAELTMQHIEKRATEIGPVLEAILENHWRHWGLNE